MILEIGKTYLIKHARKFLFRLFRYGTDREKKLENLVCHCWVYSGYENCGYKHMTKEQKALFNSVIENQ
jgi:hypothetical protein